MDYVYLWADGIHVNIRLEEHNLCLQVMIGVCADGRKDLIAPRGWLSVYGAFRRYHPHHPRARERAALRAALFNPAAPLVRTAF